MGNDIEGQLIGLLTGQNPHVLLGMLGILKSGHGFVPLDPLHPDERLRFIIADCRLKLLVTEARYLRQGLALAAQSPTLQHVICVDAPPSDIAVPENVQLHRLETAEPPTPSAAHPRVEPDRIAYVIYTSGSTGMPKGVLISDRNLIPLLQWSLEYFKLGPHTRVLQTLNHCFDFGVMEQLTTLLCGGTMHFLDQEARSDLARYAEYIQAHAVNTIHATPAFFQGIVALSDDLSSLQLVHLGGEALSPELIEAIYARISETGTIYNGYGPTETTINCAIFALPPKTGFNKQDFPIIPIGYPSANNRLYVLDPRGNPCPIGVPGELHVGGPAVSRGYLNRPDLTAERFIPDPFGPEPEGRLYKTGDLVRFRPDGAIEFLGRIDHQVKIRGFRIELGEIESVLGQHPAVQEAVVLARADERGEKRLVAYVLTGSAAPLPLDELRQFLREKLPTYMVPAAFVPMAAWPLTPNGKIDRRALPEPENLGQEQEQAYAAPRTPTETALVEIWQQVLNRERVGIRDNFFELGGHSLLATQVISRIRQALGADLQLNLLFDRPTIAELAPIVEERRKEAGQSAAIPAITGRRRPAPATQLQDALEQLSEDELAALLNEMLAKKRGKS